MNTLAHPAYFGVRMQAPIQLKYVGYSRKRGDISDVKRKYRGYDPGLDVESEQEKLVFLDADSPNNIHEASLEFARDKLRDHPDEWEVVDDPDGSRRKEILASKPVRAMASANIVVTYPDGTKAEYPPGTNISIAQPTPKAKPTVEKQTKLGKVYTEQQLFVLSKPKIQRAAKKHLDAALDPDQMGKSEMVEEYLRLQAERG